jgi:hypothetical protein
MNNGLGFVLSESLKAGFEGTEYFFGKTNRYNFIPVRIIYNNPTTICYFQDGSKEVVCCSKDEPYVKEVGVMSCIMKKIFMNRNQFKRLVDSGYVQPSKSEISKGWTKACKKVKNDKKTDRTS